MKVSQKPNQPLSRQVLIRFSGPANTSVFVRGNKLTKIQGILRLNLVFFTIPYSNLITLNQMCMIMFQSVLDQDAVLKYYIILFFLDSILVDISL